ncbi:SRA stem-loop-interacting RNA-binding protein, mitochondrial [Oncorhynchus clarkii lewisi]|uniref:SRA stem-loop-interacting RNA-binding protein, mitochondrial n=1 Tax=Oncorhynchus clarkii lewisi TaxID=490388 RepID=UPI0039B99A86
MAGSSKKVYEVFVSKIPWTLASKQDKETGFHRGFCWIGYTSEEGLNNALRKDPHVLEGSTLQVQRNRKQTKRWWRQAEGVCIYEG